MTTDGYELVRMSTELIDRLTDGSAPVTVLRTIRNDDGTVELVLQTPGTRPVAEV